MTTDKSAAPERLESAFAEIRKLVSEAQVGRDRYAHIEATIRVNARHGGASEEEAEAMVRGEKSFIEWLAKQYENRRPDDMTADKSAAPCTHCFGRSANDRCLGCGAQLSIQSAPPTPAESAGDELREAMTKIARMDPSKRHNGNRNDLIACQAVEIAAAPAPAPQPELCEDEGCPHHGTPHVCLNLPQPAVMVHRDTGCRVTLTTDAALARFFDNRCPDDWYRRSVDGL